SSQPPRGEPTEIEPDRDRQRRGDQKRDEGADSSPVEEEQGAVVVLDRVPRGGGEEVDPVPRDREMREREDLPDDRPDRRQRQQRGGEGQKVEKGVAQPVEQPAAGGGQGRRRRNGAHREPQP